MKYQWAFLPALVARYRRGGGAWPPSASPALALGPVAAVEPIARYLQASFSLGLVCPVDSQNPKLPVKESAAAESNPRPPAFSSRGGHAGTLKSRRPTPAGRPATLYAKWNLDLWERSE
ncbi:hypothetical protein NL676_016870 [Syzygium grande]|nr:hypothetical protein NL676_016870 [Syzygium grande]